MNLRNIPLNSSGSSRLRVWPLLGNTTKPLVGMVRFIMSDGSRAPSSSSPTMIITGTDISAMASWKSYSDGLSFWKPRMVRADPREECSASMRVNSSCPLGSLT